MKKDTFGNLPKIDSSYVRLSCKTFWRIFLDKCLFPNKEKKKWDRGLLLASFIFFSNNEYNILHMHAFSEFSTFATPKAKQESQNRRLNFCS